MLCQFYRYLTKYSKSMMKMGRMIGLKIYFLSFSDNGRANVVLAEENYALVTRVAESSKGGAAPIQIGGQENCEIKSSAPMRRF